MVVKNFWVSLLVVNAVIFVVLASKEEAMLVTRDVLKSIGPNYEHVKLPPGFPAINTISTDKFKYKTAGSRIEVSANLDETITMFPGLLIITNIQLKFFFNKMKPKEGWHVKVKGAWELGSSTLTIDITPDGQFKAHQVSLKLSDITKKFMKNTSVPDIGISMSAFTFQNVNIFGEITSKMEKINITFKGSLKNEKLSPIPVKISVTKDKDSQDIQMFSMLEFKDIAPRIVLRELLNQRVLNVPFFAHLLASSSLFNAKKNIFGLAFSYNEVYDYKEQTVSSTILNETLQSHIPAGITLLFPLQVQKDAKKQSGGNQKKQGKFKGTRSEIRSTTVNIAFVINRPLFDLLISPKNRILVKEILPILSSEFFTEHAANTLPRFLKGLNGAYTTHISFDSSTFDFSLFIRLQAIVELIPDLIRINVTNLVLQKNIQTSSIPNHLKDTKWKVSAKGRYTISQTVFDVQYSRIEEDKDEIYGLTGSTRKMKLDDIIDEFEPDFYPSNEVKDMIENTEIDTLNMHDVKLYSRIQEKDGTPHILITGLTDLPQWEKNIQVALLLYHRDETWECKLALSLKHSPLTSIIEALTGFDSTDITFLHNSHIMTTLISSPVESFRKLPSHIITTPLLRLPVKKGLFIIALLRFPDTCGDDKLCVAASKILDTNKLFTTKGVLSTNPFKLCSNIVDDINFTDHIKGVNNTIELSIGNTSRLDVRTSIHLPYNGLVFDGLIHLYKTGGIQLQMHNRKRLWFSPFSMRTLAFKDLHFVANYTDSQSMQTLNLRGKVLLGIQGNGGEIEANVRIAYNPSSPSLSMFQSNLTDISLTRLLEAFILDVTLPSILKESSFPSGLMLTYSGSQNDYSLHGELEIFGRLIYCSVSTKHAGYVKIVTDNSLAPIIFAKGLIIIQQSEKVKLRGPKIIAEISHRGANVVMKGFVKMLGIASSVNIELKDTGIEFSVSGKIMDYKQTKLKAVSTNTPDLFQVSGCLEDVAFQVQFLLVETILRSANQSVLNMEKAEENFLIAKKYFAQAEQEETEMLFKRDNARIAFEDALIEYGKYIVKTKEVCPQEQCKLKCFGCPKLNRCCRLDIFGHCISCPAWKSCCWKNIDPMCIAKKDGCRVIKAQAEKELSMKEAFIVQQRIILDNLEQLLTKAEVEKGKHKAVLEAAIDAKQIVEEDSTPGLNAHDAIKTFGAPYGWAKVNSVCYDTSIVQAATGCMNFQLNVELFDHGNQNLSVWSCLKEDLVTELTESIANYMFPKLVDTSADSITEVTMKLNGAEIQNQVSEDEKPIVSNLLQGLETPDSMVIGIGNYTGTKPPTFNSSLIENIEFDTHLQETTSINNSESQISLVNSNSTGEFNVSKLPNLQTDTTQGNSESLPDAISSDARPKVNKTPDLGQSPVNENSLDNLDVVSNNTNDIPERNEQNNNSENLPNSIVSVDSDKNGNDGGTKLQGSNEYNVVTSGEDESSTYDSEGTSGSAFLSGEGDITQQGKEKEDSKEINNQAYKVTNEAKIMDSGKVVNNEKTPVNYLNNNLALIYQKDVSTMETQNKTEMENFNSNINVTKEGEKPRYKKYNNNFPYIYPAINTYAPKQPKQFPFYYPQQRAQYKLQSQQASKPSRNYKSKLHGIRQPGHIDYQQAMIFSPYNNGPSYKSNFPVQQQEHHRKRRSVSDQHDSGIQENVLLYTEPFWDIQTDRNIDAHYHSEVYPIKKHTHTILSRMIQKRWNIPEKPVGKCHIFRQLMEICKDMAETIIILDKSLKEAKRNFLEKDKDVYLELFQTEEDLVDAAKRVNVSGIVAMEAAKTLSVVREGVNIWSKRCNNEFEWQKQTGVNAWLQAMDLRIQELGGYGVFRFLDNLFNAFQALFERGVIDTSQLALNYEILEKTRRISGAFHKVFKEKLDVPVSRGYADEILSTLEELKSSNIPFCR